MNKRKKNKKRKERNDKKENIMEVIGEKVTFLTSSKEKEEKD